MDINRHAAVTLKVAGLVADAMKQRGITESALSDATGIPRPTLRRRLAGVSAFNVSELARVGVALDLSASELLAQAERRVAATAT